MTPRIGISSNGSHPGAQRFRIVMALARGAATARQVSEATGLDFFCCSALLSRLFERRLVRRSGKGRRGSGYVYFL